jgi:hypothetical protein
MGREGETDGEGKGNRVRGGSQSGAVGFDQGTSKDGDSPPWTRANILSTEIFLQLILHAQNIIIHYVCVCSL